MKVVRRDPAKGYLADNLWVPKSAVNVEGLKQALSFQFFDQRELRILAMWRETEHHVVVPREFWKLEDLEFPVVDCRPTSYPTADIRSKITLDFVRPHETTQKDAVAALLGCHGGLLQLRCGAGKTVIALEVAARLKVPTIIVIDNSQLLRQWQESIEKFLEIPDGVGLIQADSFVWKKPVVLATYQTLASRAETFPEEARRWFGVAIFEEAHHVAAPTWARAADLFLGRRYGLSATPDRPDGMHVLHQFHVGPVVFKDLRQPLKPSIFFKWTGLRLDTSDARIAQMVTDCTGEVHIGKVASYFATWRTRLELVINEVKKATSEGRKVLVVSKSVDELINLLALWNGLPNLYTDVPWGTPADVGATAAAVGLEEAELKRIKKKLETVNRHLATDKGAKELNILRQQRDALRLRIEQHEVFKKLEGIRNKKQREYLKVLLSMPSTAGLMIYKVSPDARMEMLRTKQVTFAVAKYGREGLDEASLDTLIVSTPISDRNTLQQLMGRVLREKEGKKNPVVVFLEDDVGPFIGMCKKLRRHLREWAAEDGGPFDYTNVGYPTRSRKVKQEWTSTSSTPLTTTMGPGRH